MQFGRKMRKEFMSIYDYTVEAKDGSQVPLKDYEGKVLLIINSATECGFTPQYKELEEMYKEDRDKGFEILDFPCNQFGGQAPGTDDEITNFCSLNYGVDFPQFHKIDVNGPDASPLFTYLKEQKGFEGFDPNNKLTPVLEDILSKQDPDYAESPDIKWNFTKFLIGRDGKVIARYEPTTSPAEIQKAIEELL